MFTGQKIIMVSLSRKKWKRELGLINVEPSRLVAVPPIEEQGKHRMR